VDFEFESAAGYSCFTGEEGWEMNKAEPPSYVAFSQTNMLSSRGGMKVNLIRDEEGIILCYR